MPTQTFESRTKTVQSVLDTLIRKIDDLPKTYRELLADDSETLSRLISKQESTQVNQMFERSEERFRLAAHAVQGIVYDWDMVNNYVHRSEGIQRLIGLTNSEINTSNAGWTERIHPDDLRKSKQELDNVLEGDSDIFESEYRVRHKDGHWVFVWDRCYIVRDNNGRPVRAVGYTTDITHLKQANAALKVSEDRYRDKAVELEAIMDAVPAYVWITHDPESRFITGNRAAHEVLRMASGQNLSKTAPEPEIPHHFRAMSGGMEIPPHELPVQMAARGNIVRDYEYDLVFDDGETICLIGNATPIFDEEGNPAGSVSAFIDITERKRIERQYRLFFDNLQEIVVIVEAIRDEQGQVVDWVYRDANSLGAAILNHTRETLIGKRLSQFLSDIDSAARVKRYAEVLATGEPWTYETGIRGSYYMITVFRMDSSSIAITSIDITARRNAEEAQRKVEEKNREYLVQVEIQRRLTEYRERERQELAREIHDGPIQTLVSSIFNLQYLKEAFDNPTLRVELDQLGLTLKSAVRELREIINELRPPSLIRFGLVKAIQIHAADFQERHPELTLDLDLQENASNLNEATSLTLFRIYQESLNNIVRHAHASRAWVTFRQQTNLAQLEIRDDGKGFTIPHDLANLARTGHFGLAGMVERAETIGGQLHLASGPGGTTVRVHIPVK